MSKFPTYFPKIKSAEVLKENAIKFIIRENYLDEINDSFQTNQILVIHSFDGVGKTTLALQYCNRLISNDYDACIRWFNADSSEKLQLEYKRLSKLLDINGDDLNFIIERINMKLKQFQKEILFVFDGVESYDHIDKYINTKLPKNIKILITTRDQSKHIDYPKIEIEPFGINEAQEYINKNLAKHININDELMNRILELAKSTNEYIFPIKL